MPAMGFKPMAAVAREADCKKDRLEMSLMCVNFGVIGMRKLGFYTDL